MSNENFFEFSEYYFDGPNRTAFFDYSINIVGNEALKLREKLYFPEPFPVKKTIDSEVLDRILFNLHLVLGISYWKMYCLKNLIIKTHQLTQEQANFWNVIYRKGLGEFFYKNSIDYRDLNIFPVGLENIPPEIIDLQRIKKRALVGIGGGKDSAVAIEILKKKSIETKGFYVATDGRHGAEEEIVQVADINYMRVERSLDPQLLSLARTGKIPSGHVPVSALYAFVGVLLGVLYDYDHVVTGNERSADYGNVIYLGEVINHQWSKSSEFENMFNKYVGKFITPSVKYGSILREYSELKIVEMFTKYPNYFPVFSSCNNVSEPGKKSVKKWCGSCAKCAFVFACLSAFLPKETLMNIFGKNIFSDYEMVPMFKRLLGIYGTKPFDCVGTPEEVKVALNMASKTGSYDNDPVIDMFKKEIVNVSRNIDDLEKSVMKSQSSTHPFSL